MQQDHREFARPFESSGSSLALLGLRILVVEDALDLQLLLSQILGFQGAEVSLASHGAEALALIDSSQRFNCIIMDLQMPVLDGYETTQRLRAAGNSTPILAITAHALAGEKERCLALGFTDFMSKPVDFMRLISLLQSWTRSTARVC